MSDVWDEVIERLRGEARERGAQLRHFKVLKGLPLRAVGVGEEEEVIEEGDDDVTVSTAVKKYREEFGINRDDMIRVLVTDDEFYVQEVVIP